MGAIFSAIEVADVDDDIIGVTVWDALSAEDINSCGICFFSVES